MDIRKHGVVTFVVGLLFMKAGLANGAEATCLGQWHFELSSPKPDKDAWLSKGSWCHAKNLPKTLDFGVQLGNDGRVIMFGNPLPVTHTYRPTDITGATSVISGLKILLAVC